MNRKLAVVFLVGASIAPAQSESALLLSDCSDSSDVKRVLQSSDQVTVRHSLAGYSQTCYAVSVTAQKGEIVDGFLMGAGHPAVTQFELHEQSYLAQALSAPTDTRPKQAKPPFSSRAGTK